MSQHNLTGMKCYLSGSIEASRDHGIVWRKEFIDLCWQNDLPIGFIDPCNKGPGAVQEEIGDERRKLQALKAEGSFDEVTDIMKQVRRWDLRAVDYSNFVVAVIDRNVPTWGTVDECIVAERQRKPIIGIVKGGPSQAPDWLFAMMKHEEMFETAEQAVEHLCKIDRGDVPLDKRWIEITGLWENEQRYTLPLLR